MAQSSKSQVLMSRSKFVVQTPRDHRSQDHYEEYELMLHSLSRIWEESLEPEFEREPFDLSDQNLEPFDLRPELFELLPEPVESSIFA